MGIWDRITRANQEESAKQEEGSSVASSEAKKTDPDMEAFQAEAEGYQPIGAGFGASDPGPKAASSAPTNTAFLVMGWKMIFRTVARRGGAHWLLSEEEARQLGEASGPVVDKYLPSILNKYGAEIMLAWTVTMVVIPRIGGGSGSEGQEEKNQHHHGATGSGEKYAS